MIGNKIAKILQTLCFILCIINSNMSLAVVYNSYDNLMTSIQNRDLPKIKQYLRNSDNIQKTTTCGCNVIHQAVKTGRLEIVATIVNYIDREFDDALFSQKNKKGFTPVALAAELKHYQVTMFLLEHGSDLNMLNQDQKDWLRSMQEQYPTSKEKLSKISHDNHHDHHDNNSVFNKKNAKMALLGVVLPFISYKLGFKNVILAVPMLIMSAPGHFTKLVSYISYLYTGHTLCGHQNPGQCTCHEHGCH